ncbi:MAG: type 2 isopentenyl-diphosphate Delta-isomerase [Candidatus Aenigmatarchaeota archaeon]|nr:type 2 isopentenyl-diphosphate Delta-isomerase [Candidatus Aenigmarchaeota archaeon]
MQRRKEVRSESEKTSKRKEEHIKICLDKNIEHGSTLLDEISFWKFEDIDFIHNALPEVDLEKIDISVEFLGKKLNAPIIISGMTGGAKIAERINKNLAKAAENLNLAMGVGSQRAAIENKDLEKTYYVRDVAPNIFLIANLGVIQLNYGYGIKEVKRAIDMIDANAIALHLNALQEAIQPEGNTNWSGCYEKLKKICESIKKPVIVKETGCGISKEVAKKIEAAGASAIDISGRGGTSWGIVEMLRRKKASNNIIAKEWGIPTAISLLECLSVTKIPIIASGGIRNGLEIAKCLALGAIACGIALPLLKPALKSSEEVENKLKEIIEEIKIAMFLVGAKDIKELRKRPLVITGKTKEWAEVREIDIKKLANRNE